MNTNITLTVGLILINRGGKTNVSKDMKIIFNNTVSGHDPTN